MTRMLLTAAAIAAVAVAVGVLAIRRHQPARPKPFVVGVGGDLERTLPRLLGLERRVARTPGVGTVRGPATVIDRAVARAERRIAAVSGGTARGYADALVRLGSIGRPALTNRSFVTTLVYGSGTAPTPRFRAYLPDSGHALVFVQPEPGLGGEETSALRRRIEGIARAARLGVFEVRG
jgi:hypothetical protein